ncbi:hypothetical protein NCS55_00353700 [Fusarium keratoplasticum]|nr:hypothetical protein NCS55_00353700 [Fusarium keratoplasticum]
MTAVRALIRRGLAQPPDDRLLAAGSELEWLSLTLLDSEMAWWPFSGFDVLQEKTLMGWWPTTGGSRYMYSPLREMTVQKSPESKAHRAMIVRKDLGNLACWPAVAAVEAAALARAIKITMDTLLGSSRTNEWIWPMRTHYPETDSESTVHFRLRCGDTGSLASMTSELEAALSLWLFSVNYYEMKQESSTRHSQTPVMSRRAKMPLKNSSLRLLGEHRRGLHRDLGWWMPDDATRILKVQKCDRSKETVTEDTQRLLDVQDHRIVGCGSLPRVGLLSFNTRFQSSPLPKSHADVLPDEPIFTLPDSCLAVESFAPLQLLYAQDMFASFMRSLAKAMQSPIPDGSDIFYDSQSSSMNWDSFKLRNDRLTRLIQEISNTGLGSVDEISVSLIPALSAEHKLPDPSAIVELAHKHAKRYHVQQEWEKACKPYLWLSDISRSFPKDSVFSVRSIAVLLECVRIMTQALEMRCHMDDDEVFNPLDKAKNNIEFQIKLWLESNDSLTGRTILSHLMTLYNEQGRKWIWDSWETSQDPTTIPNTTTDYPHTFGFGRLHRLCQEGRRLTNERVMAALNPGQSVKQPDVLNWTPLHYIAVNGSAGSVELLLELDADVNCRDLVDWTPLHYACQRGNRSTMRSLLRAGADVHLRGIDGVSSLQCAAMGGHADVAEFLIKAGAALDVLDNAGNTWLHWAAYNGHDKFIKDMKPRLQALEMNGTKINVENHAKKKPLDLAFERGHEAVIQLLKDMDRQARVGGEGRSGGVSD